MPLMTRREIEKAIDTKGDSYPAFTVCAICREFWIAHNGSLCPKCSICGRHGLQHNPKPANRYEVIDLQRGGHVWVICHGGTTTFLPELECDA